MRGFSSCAWAGALGLLLLAAGTSTGFAEKITLRIGHFPNITRWAIDALTPPLKRLAP